ncbi:MAG: nitroreductase family protein [Proteobacteria bacterium]|nr:nitroreductase family protein [Pseudomonadota bacterium]MBU1739261.1 nitroreductase family protein [Pseudomonadota bacterium]
MGSQVLEAIYKRRSIRDFTDRQVAVDDLREIVRAGTWAPSGLNNQPWRFVIICDRSTRLALAEQTRYSHIIRSAPALIAVFLDTDAMYNEVKDHQAAGACIQNMLLATEALGLGAVWLGEILNRKEQVNRVLGLSEQFDLMAVLATGYPAGHDQSSSRKEIHDVIIKEIMEDN